MTVVGASPLRDEADSRHDLSAFDCDCQAQRRAATTYDPSISIEPTASDESREARSDEVTANPVCSLHGI